MFQLRANIHWCVSADRAVFLDIDEDRYFCLPQEANAAFLRLARGALDPGDEEQLGVLITSKVLEASGSKDPLRQPPLVPPAVRDLPAVGVSAGPATIARMLVRELGARRALRKRPFAQVLAMVLKVRPSGKGSEAALRALVTAEDRVALVTGSHDRCLVRGLAMAMACRRIGHRPKLVFGVIAHPFSAHCWVQLGDEVLVGGYEQARLYTPILVVE